MLFLEHRCPNKELCKPGTSNKPDNKPDILQGGFDMAYLDHGKIYAFDFDGTLCKDAYPGIGKPNKAMIRYAKKLEASGMIVGNLPAS